MSADIISTLSTKGLANELVGRNRREGREFFQRDYVHRAYDKLRRDRPAEALALLERALFGERRLPMVGDRA